MPDVFETPIIAELKKVVTKNERRLFCDLSFGDGFTGNGILEGEPISRDDHEEMD